MKKIKYIYFTAMLMFIVSCGDDFLNQKNLFEKYDSDYYKNATDVAEALAGAYDVLPSYSGASNPIVMANLMSDECFGGGGPGDNTLHELDLMTCNPENSDYYYLWTEYYKGILRANMIIKKFNQATFEKENDKNQALGEAYFLRAYYYFTLSKFFGNVPLITEPGPANKPKADADVMYAQIASDMKKAIELMPAIPFTDLPEERIGHANKWVAEGIMARIFLFYTGYYNKTELPLVEGGSVSKDQVIAWVDDCIATSGHDVVSDFRNIWPYSYVNDGQYPYASKNNLFWIGEGKENKETMFAVKYSVYGGWNKPTKITYCNQICLYMGLRQQTDLVPWSNGWGAGTVNPQILNEFEPGDIRLKGSIIDVNDTALENTSKYVWNSFQCMNETGLWNKKYTSIQKKVNGSIVGMFLELIPSTPNNNQLWNLQDEILLRFADVLLMGAELGSSHAQAYLDKVRNRVGLSPVPVSLNAIKHERLVELAFEGIRYFDLLRWHDAETAFAKVKDVPVQNQGVDELYSSSYRKETGGFIPIPETEIRLSAGVLKQNPGW